MFQFTDFNAISPNVSQIRSQIEQKLMFLDLEHFYLEIPVIET